MAVIVDNMYMNNKVIEVIEHHMLISHCPSRRRSIGPLPSCFILTSFMNLRYLTGLKVRENMNIGLG